MKEEKLLRKVLEDHSYKITKARLSVFGLLLEGEPQPIGALVKRLTGQVDRVSVYRVIDLYEKLGIVNRLAIGWKYKLELSDIFLDHHHHITCVNCGRIVAIKESDEVERIIGKLGQTSGFTLTSHQLELQGYCKSCKMQPKASSP